jgi:hypothetical protein
LESKVDVCAICTESCNESDFVTYSRCITRTIVYAVSRRLSICSPNANDIIELVRGNIYVEC